MKYFKFLTQIILLSAVSFSFTLAQSYIYLKDDNGVLHGMIRYEPTFLNKYVKTNILCLSKMIEGINCEYVADSSPIAKEPAQTL